MKLANSSAGGMFLDSQPPAHMAESQRRIQFPASKRRTSTIFARILQKHAEENLSIKNIGSKARIPKPRRRDVLDPTLWASGKIEATPHGHFAEMMTGKPRKEGSERPRSRRVTSGSTTRSTGRRETSVSATPTPTVRCGATRGPTIDRRGSRPRSGGGTSRKPPNGRAALQQALA